MKAELEPTLTNGSQTPYSKGGDISMAENNGEIKQPVSEQAIKSGEKKFPQVPPKESNKKNNEKPRETTGGDQVFNGKPLGEWKTEELKAEYKRSFKAEQKAEAKVTGFAEKEKIAAEAQPYNNLLAEALENRGVNMTELFLETVKSSAEEGYVVRSVGAATIVEIIDKSGITNEFLLKELNAIDALAGLGKSKENILGEALERVALSQEGKSPEEKKKFDVEKGEVINRIRKKTDEIIAENLRKMRTEYRAQGLYGDRKLTEEEKEQITNAKKPEEIEKLFNRMFDRVDSRPQADFTTAFGTIGIFEHDEFMKTLNEAITENNDKGNRPRAKELTLIVQRFANERAARETIHNAYFGVLAGADTEKMAGFIDSFNSGWADMAFSKGGVTQAMHFYEQALLIVRESAGGFLKPVEVVGEMKKDSEV